MDDANEIVALPTGLRRHIVKTIEFRKRRKKKDSGRKKKTTRLLSGKQRTRMERKEMLRKKEKN
jgi:hypothetical protein